MPRKIILSVTAAMALVSGSSAQAADKAAGWKNWVDHATRISTAADAYDLGAVNEACRGSLSTIISQGFQFPYWAQMLPQFCSVYKTENRQRIITVKGWRAECKLLGSRIESLAKAEPVPEEARAAPLALHMADTLKALQVRECTHKPERDRG
jgi:hypothetical protein